MGPAIAVIGSGPAGLYCAEKLARDLADARIDVIERWPTPFGLVRGGVAADHQVTKAVTRVLERPLATGRIGFLGGVELGRDVMLDEIRACYDAVVIAIGAGADRRLGVPGEDLPGVIGSGAFVAWANSCPGAHDLAPFARRARHVVLVGNGNVALDVARLIAKTPAEFAGSDLDPGVEAALAEAPLQTITILGRRGAGDTGFSAVELEELGRLARARPWVDADGLPADGPVAEILRGFADAGRDAPVGIRFLFGRRPAAFLGKGRVEAVRVARAEGGEETLPADLVVTCIGYATHFDGLPVVDGHVANDEGRVEPGLYVTGWARRGPSGTIATNRAEAHQVALRVVAEIGAGADRPGADGLAEILASRGVLPVRWDGWCAIDAAERAAAPEGRVRLKLRTVDALRVAARVT
jgi:ferredoxin--NADP+ reductase